MFKRLSPAWRVFDGALEAPPQCGYDGALKTAADFCTVNPNREFDLTTRPLAPDETNGLEQASPIVWISKGDERAFVFETSGQTGFLGFFLMAAKGDIAPMLSFDNGQGFNDLTALRLKAFPFGFYHVSLAKMGDVKRLRFRPTVGPATFRFLAITTQNALLIAVLHYLFNLRYQKISLVSPDQQNRVGSLSWIKANVTRIAKFFKDVSAGSGIRVQEDSKEALSALNVYLSLEANAVGSKMSAILGSRADAPLISFVSPTFNTSAVYLSDLVQSFRAQGVDYAELVLSDDGSSDRAARGRLSEMQNSPHVRVVLNPENRGIAAATNDGIKAAKGEWIAFIDHDDQFAPGSIAVIAQAIHEHPDADFFYTDEIITDVALRPIGSFMKPAFDSVLLSGMNYINHFSIFRRTRLEDIGCLRTDREGSQDYDLILRYLMDPKPGSVIHIPFLAYIWRRQEKTYSSIHVDRSIESARRALTSAYKSAGRAVDVSPALDQNLHKIQFLDTGSKPLVSIIIPNYNSLALIQRIVDDLMARTDYPAIEIVIVDNGTDDAEVLSFYAALVAKTGAITVDIVKEAFNFSSMCNRGARLASGSVLLFLNNDIEVEDKGWLSEMVSCLAFDAVGIVGAKLLYPTGRVQHNGVIVGLGQAAGHWYIDEAPDDPGPMGRFNVRQTLTAVTGACMLVTRQCFQAVGGFDEDVFPIAYNDIDLCLRAKTAGFRAVWTPFAQLIHHESASRGSDEDGENNVRFKKEMANLQARHGTADYIDDAYSPFYDRRYSKPQLIIPPGLPEVRGNRFP